jgi:glucose-6-phosphate dehydrogenase assembly protein OpcA
MHQIQLGEILDVTAVERELRMLWQDSTADQFDEEIVLMRACVANLIIVLSNESGLDELNKTLQELSAVHPNRAIVNVAARHAGDQDIELFVSSFNQSDSKGRKRLSGEEIVLIARGKFVPELPSAALPLLIPDLPTFLWWHDDLEFDDRTFLDFCRAADRLVIDSVDDQNTRTTMFALARLFAQGRQQQLGISDINWARLTSWRGLLASFYDSERCKSPLTRISGVEIDYSASENDPAEVAPQALMILGWLASRLKWELAPDEVQAESGRLRLAVLFDNRRIHVELKRVARPEMKPGRLARVQLNGQDKTATFAVLRDEQGRHLETQAQIDGCAHPGRILPVRNRSNAHLLGRELEILSNDNIYAEAVQWAANLLHHIDIGPRPSV